MSSTSDPEVSFIIPCLNEEETIGNVIEEIKESFGEELRFEILVSDNGSTDRSREISSDLGARVVEVPLKGYGNALRSGIAECSGRIAVMGDADMSYTFGDAKPLISQVREGADLAMGNRFGGGIHRGAMPFLHRWLGNPVLSLLGRLLHGAKVRDFHCGLRAFNVSSIRALNLRSEGMEFASEMVVSSVSSGYCIAESKVTLRPDGRSRAPHLKTWSDGWRHLSFLVTEMGSRAKALLWALMIILIFILTAPLTVAKISSSDADVFGPRSTFFLLILSSIMLQQIFIAQLGFRSLTAKASSSDVSKKYVSWKRWVLSAFFLIGVGSLVVLVEYIRWWGKDFGPNDTHIFFFGVGIAMFSAGTTIASVSLISAISERSRNPGV